MNWAMYVDIFSLEGIPENIIYFFTKILPIHMANFPHECSCNEMGYFRWDGKMVRILDWSEWSEVGSTMSSQNTACNVTW